MKDYEEIMNSVKYNIETQIYRAYQQGYEDGKKASCDCKDNMEAEYNRGLNEAWEAARKIAKLGIDEQKRLFGCFGIYFISHEDSASEAISKIKEYEEEQKQDAEIKVGDEVVIDDSIGIVTRAFPGAVTCYVMRKDGSSGEEDRNDCKTTGRHFDQIAEVLNEMRCRNESD